VVKFSQFASPQNIDFEGPKFLRIKFLRPDKNPRNPQKFSPSKILGYTVILRSDDTYL